MHPDNLASECPGSALEFKSISVFEFGGSPVRNPAYLLLEYSSSYVSDSSSLEPSEWKPGSDEWTDDEIRAIRVVLKKLTANRIMNAGDVEDLVQETLLTLISKQPRTELSKGPLVWSLGILRKKVGNYYRKTQRYAPLYENKTIEQQETSVISPEGRFLHEELKGLVDEALSQIPPFQREALKLVIAGLSAREITEELHPVRYQNVINRIHRGRKKLAEALAKYGYGPDAMEGMRKMKPGRGQKTGETRQEFAAKRENAAGSRNSCTCRNCK
jgi:RNA polymerase sigma factor (sigma-70 family)